MPPKIMEPFVDLGQGKIFLASPSEMVDERVLDRVRVPALSDTEIEPSEEFVLVFRPQAIGGDTLWRHRVWLGQYSCEWVVGPVFVRVNGWAGYMCEWAVNSRMEQLFKNRAPP